MDIKAMNKEELSAEVEKLRKRILELESRDSDCHVFSGDCPVTAVAAGAVDVTEKRKTEDELEVAEKNYKAIFDSINVPILIQDFESGQVIDANKAAFEYYDIISLDYLKSPEYWKGVAPQYSFDEVSKILNKARTEIQKFEWITRNSRGVEKWAEIMVRVIELGGKRVFISTVLDIHARKLAVEALNESQAMLRKSEELYRTLAESANEMIFMIDEEGVIRFVNNCAAKSYGARPEDIIGRKHNDMFPPEIAKRHNAQMKKVFETGKHLYSYDRMERMKNPDRTIWIDAMLVPVKDETGKVVAVIGISRDITERKKMNEEILRSSKLESLGTLAGGIAHDFNNVLMGIIGNLTLAKKQAPGEEKLYELLVRAEKIALKAKNLTEQLITFSRGGVPIKKVASINDLVKDSAQFASTGSNMVCDFSLQNDLWNAEVDEGQITQVFTNLVINSQQAMPDGGRIKIKTSNVVVKPEDAGALPAGNYVSISFSDTGHGIAQEILPRIFDPFFSTKEKGKGLGLATAYSIIKMHSGSITVESKEEQGTLFIVYIPACTGNSNAEPIRGAVTGNGKSLDFTGLRILVMDDEESVLFPICDMLTDMGCQARAAVNGEQAIEEFRKSFEAEEPIEVLLLDLVVKGGLGGVETLNRIRMIDKNVKAIVSSGYSNDPIMARYKDFGFSGVLVKPYVAENIIELLSRIKKAD